MQAEAKSIPKHVAIIMDGNGRWAKKRLLTRSAGHRAGAQALKKLAKEADKLGIKYLSVYAFSTENWKRPAGEVYDLMNLLREYIKQYIDDVKKNNLKIRVIGDRSRLDADLQSKISRLEELTAEKPGIQVVIALNYGGRDEIVRGIRKLLAEDPADITEDTLQKYLDTGDIPDPELVIRTSGEQRMSNFLLWQTAYSELYFTNKLWPDFNIDDLKAAIEDFWQRKRRYGGL